MKRFTKILTILLCISVMQPALSMHKFSSLFKNFKNKNFVSNYTNFKSRLRKKSIKTAKSVGIVSLTLATTLYTAGKHYNKITLIPSHKEPKDWKDKSYKEKLEYWHSLTEGEKNSLLWRYKPGYFDNLNSFVFLNCPASNFNKFVMFKALIKRLQDGEERNDLMLFLDNCNKEEKDILFPYIVNHIARDIPLEDLQYYQDYYEGKQKQLFDHFIQDNIKKMTIQGTLTAQQAQADAMNVYASFSDFLGSMLGKKFVRQPELKELLLKAQELEKKYMDQGYYVFFHGQTKEHFFNAFITTKLHDRIFPKQDNNPHLLLRCFDYQNNEQDTTTKNIEHALQKRTEILQYPTEKYHKHRADIVFCNSGLYNNAENTGSFTPHYVAMNTNQHHPTLSLHDIFARFGQQHVYNKNKKVIDTIRRYFIENDTFSFLKHEPGVLLVIAIPKHLVDNYVYITESGAPRITTQVGSLITDKPSVVLKALEKDPKLVKNYSNLEYGFIATQDVLESGSEKGIRIEYLHAKDPEIFNGWEKKIDQILKECTPSQTGSPWENYKNNQSFFKRFGL